MLNHTISKWDKTNQKYGNSKYNTPPQSSTLRNIDHITTKESHGDNSQAKYQNWNKATCIHYFVSYLYLPGAYKKAHLIVNGNTEVEKKVYVGHLHHYSPSVALIWDPKTKLVSTHFNVAFDDNFETVQCPNPEVKMDNTMGRLFKTNNYKYDVPFRNEHT
jgi:hypothetical protein